MALKVKKEKKKLSMSCKCHLPCMPGKSLFFFPEKTQTSPLFQNKICGMDDFLSLVEKWGTAGSSMQFCASKKTGEAQLGP